MNLAELCTPAQIYFVISIITLILAVIKQFKFSTIMMKLITIAVWTWFLNFLCSKGYKAVSWFLVLLPFLAMALGFIMLMDTAAARAPQQRHPQQQQYRQ